MVKRFIWGVSVFIFAFFAAVQVGAQAIRAEDLIYLTEQFPPHNYMEGNQLKGISIEILQQIWQKLNLPDETRDVELVPWARGMARIKKEPNIVLFAMGYSSERLKFLQWVGPYFSHSLYLIGKKTRHFKIRNLADASGFKVGVIREDIGHQALEAKGFPKASLEISNHQESLFKMIDADRVDLICFMKEAAMKGLEKTGLNPDAYEMVYKVLSLHSGFGFSKKVPKSIVDDFQGALNELVRDGSVEKILNKYKLR